MRNVIERPLQKHPSSIILFVGDILSISRSLVALGGDHNKFRVATALRREKTDWSVDSGQEQQFLTAETTRAHDINLILE
jgi:hypothetical protein